MKSKLRIGFDFDGVVAYNPFRIIRFPISYLKRNILGIKKLRFWYPKARWQQIFWVILHESSIYPARGCQLLGKLTQEKEIEAYLITARYSFLDDHLNKWLVKHDLKKVFKTITLNKENEQPHLFKERMIAKLKLDYYIEDNWDIVDYLGVKGKALSGKKTKIYWIYNIMDRGVDYKHKFPYLEKALNNIVESRIMNQESRK